MARFPPPPGKPQNGRREPQKEPPAAPEAKTAPQEARNEPQKAPKRASKEAQTGLDLEGPVGLLFVAFWGAFSTPSCRRSCPCCCLLWCSVFCMLECCSFVRCCCGGFGSPGLLVLRSCFWVFLRSAEQATNRLEPKRGRRQGRSLRIIIIITPGESMVHRAGHLPWMFYYSPFLPVEHLRRTQPLGRRNRRPGASVSLSSKPPGNPPR